MPLASVTELDSTFVREVPADEEEDGVEETMDGASPLASVEFGDENACADVSYGKIQPASAVKPANPTSVTRRQSHWSLRHILPCSFHHSLSAVTPVRARAPPVLPSPSPKTPSLEDFGLSATVMSMLQPAAHRAATTALAAAPGEGQGRS